MFSYCSSFRLCMKIEESKASTGGRSVSLPQPLRGISVGGSSEGSPDHGFWTSKNFRRPRMLHLELGPRSLACRSVAVHFFVCKTSPWQWHKALQAQHENEVSTGILARQAIPSVTTWPHDHMTNALHMFFHTLPTKKNKPTQTAHVPISTDRNLRFFPTKFQEGIFVDGFLSLPQSIPSEGPTLDLRGGQHLIFEWNSHGVSPMFSAKLL